MITFFLFLILMLSFSAFFGFYCFDNKYVDSDKFSAGKIVIYFSILPTLSIIVLLQGDLYIYEYIYKRVSIIYHDDFYLLLASALPVFSCLLIYFGVLISTANKNKPSFAYSFFKKLSFQISDLEMKVLGKVFYVIAMLLFFVLIVKIGGLAAYWNDVDSRVENLGGLGYFSRGYVFLLIFSANLLFVYYTRDRAFFKASFVVLLSCICLSLLGSRSATLSFIISLIISYNFLVNKINRLVTFRTFVVAVLFVIFILGVVKLRENGAIEKYMNSPYELIVDMSDSFEKHVLMRFGRIERDILILKYFSLEKLWLGSSYKALVTAPIPRSIINNKLPLDNGVYVVNLAAGGEANINKNENLPSYSWPTGHMEAYMNFSIVGLIFSLVFSGYIFGRIYSLIGSFSFSPFFVIFYSIICFGGAPDLSVISIVKTLTSFVFFLFILFLSKLLLSIRRNYLA